MFQILGKGAIKKCKLRYGYPVYIVVVINHLCLRHFAEQRNGTQQQRKTFSLLLRPFTDKPRIHKTHNPVRTSDSNEHNLNSRCWCSCKSWHWKTGLQIYLKKGWQWLKIVECIAAKGCLVGWRHLRRQVATTCYKENLG